MQGIPNSIKEWGGNRNILWGLGGGGGGGLGDFFMERWEPESF